MEIISGQITEVSLMPDGSFAPTITNIKYAQEIMGKILVQTIDKQRKKLEEAFLQHPKG